MALEGTHINHYQIIRLIGTGGMGEVYLAQDTRIARQVAIKIVRHEALTTPHSEEAKSALRLFEREMRAISLLDHPNILPLYDFGEEKTAQRMLTYMVMPFRPEGSLRSWLETSSKGRVLPPYTCMFLLQQAASALQHAHNAQIIHLDVKPSNFLIRLRDHLSDRPDLLLTDFGIARFNTTTTTASQSIRGTPLYMAPEQWANTAVIASDQYALAIMAYQLLTGLPPFQGNMQQLMYQHLQALPKPPSSLNPHIPRAVDEVILQALAKQPGDRFPSIAQFADALTGAWQQAPTISEQAGDPEALILTERLLPKTEAPPSLPLTRHAFSPNDPAFPMRNGAAPVEAEHPEPSFRSASSFSPSIVTTPPVPHSRKQNPLLPVVIGLLLLLLGLSISGGVYFSHFSALSSPSTTTRSTDTPHPTGTLAPTSPPTLSPATGYPQLKSFYRGTATGYTNATITFSLLSEDQQGNVRMQTTFQRTDTQAYAVYDCQGQVSKDQQLLLSCTEKNTPAFHLSIHGTIFADGHMEGTEEATYTNNPSYDHVYQWSVS